MTSIVIGAASGMGKAIAHRLAGRGPLRIADINLQGVRAVADEIGGGVEAFACDLRSDADVAALLSGLDKLDSLVLTAGISGSMGTPREILDINLRGYERVLRAAEPLQQAGSVTVIFSSSGANGLSPDPDIDALVGDPFAEDFFEAYERLSYDTSRPSLAYPVSKRGVRLQAERWAPAWGARGARIVSVSPGINDTPMNRLDEARLPIMAELIARCPLGRRGTPEEIADVVEFLLSPAAAIVTGCDIRADCGMALTGPKNAYPRVEKAPLAKTA